jgi:hypothetical protein
MGVALFRGFPSLQIRMKYNVVLKQSLMCIYILSNFNYFYTTLCVIFRC